MKMDALIVAFLSLGPVIIYGRGGGKKYGGGAICINK
jgi:hypothetical protein